MLEATRVMIGHVNSAAVEISAARYLLRPAVWAIDSRLEANLLGLTFVLLVHDAAIGVVVCLFLKELVSGHLSTTTGYCHVLFGEHVTQVALLHLSCRLIATGLGRLRHLLVMAGEETISDLLHGCGQRLLLLGHVLAGASRLIRLRLLLLTEE